MNSQRDVCADVLAKLLRHRPVGLESQPGKLLYGRTALKHLGQRGADVYVRRGMRQTAAPARPHAGKLAEATRTAQTGATDLRFMPFRLSESRFFATIN